MSAYVLPVSRWFYQGAPAASGTITVYQTLTTTPVTIYSDAALTTPISNPITLDSNGECKFYVGNSVALRLDVKTSGGTLIESVDPVYPVPNMAGGLSNSGLATMSAKTIKGNATGAAAVPQDLASDDVFGLLGLISFLPQGRLTLTVATPVMTADVLAATTVYYYPYVGRMVPVYDGTQFNYYDITSSGLSLALDSNTGHTGWQQIGKSFDFFIFYNGASPVLCTGPGWPTDTSRGTGAGTSELQQINGLWVNKNTLTAKTDATANTTSVTAGQATYIGTMRATANGQTQWNIKPSAANGGGNNVLGIYNAYNRVRTHSMNRDSTSSWTYSTQTWRAMDNSTSNRISFVDGLAQSPLDAQLIASMQVSNATTVAGAIGINLDSASATPDFGLEYQNNATSSGLAAVRDTFPAQLGFHYVQAMEWATGATVTFAGAYATAGVNLQSLTLTLEM